VKRIKVNRVFFLFLILLPYSTPRVCGAGRTRRILDLAGAGGEIAVLSGTWLHTAETIILGVHIKAKFVGDIDGDGYSDFIIHSPDYEGVPQLPDDELWIVKGGPGIMDIDRAADLPHYTISFRQSGQNIFYPDAIAPAGDFDGDGFEDFFIGSFRGYFGDAAEAGIAILIFGQREFPEKFDILGPAGVGPRRLLIRGDKPRDCVGRAGAVIAGDVNGDGWKDIAVSANGPGTEDGFPHAGAVYVIYGGPDLPEEILVSDIGTKVPGFVVRGAYGDDPAQIESEDALYKVLGPGDLNGDGYDDLVLGATTATREGLDRTGAVYILYGAPTHPQEISVIDIPKTPGLGLGIHGSPVGWRFGSRLIAPGDVDGDGLPDFLVTECSKRGAAVLIYGNRNWRPLYDSSWEGLRLSVIRGSSRSALFAHAVTALGDINADRYPDFAINAPHAGFGIRRGCGLLYIVYGGPDLPREATEADIGLSVPGVMIVGPETDLHIGTYFTGGYDLDGDERPELIFTTAYFTFTQDPPPPHDDMIFILPGDFRFEFGIRQTEPSLGNLCGGYDVLLRGSGFNGEAKVWFGDSSVSEVTVLSSSEIRVTAPPSSQPGPVDVKIRQGEEEVSLEAGFTYSNAAYQPGLTAGATDNCGLKTMMIQGLSRDIQGAEDISIVFADLTGDGIEDLVLADPSYGEKEEGRISIIPGGGGYPPVMDLDDPPARVIEINGTGVPGERFGDRTVAAGDVDGDGITDLMTRGALSDIFKPPWRVYVIFGRNSWPTRISISDLLSRNGACFFGPVGSTGHSPAGDMNGDGAADFCVSECTTCGTVNLFYGGFERSEGIGDPVALFHCRDCPGWFGYSTSPVGDSNGDGFTDFLLGSPFYETGGLVGPDQVFLILGSEEEFETDSFVDDLLEDGRAVLIHKGEIQSRLGNVLLPCGDFNGDGLADAFLPDRDAGGEFNGRVTILLGNRTLGDTVREIDLREPGDAVVTVEAAYPYDKAGYAAPLGDFNRDGFADLAVTTEVNPIHNQPTRGYVIFGRPDPPAKISLARDLGAHGFTIKAAEGFSIPHQTYGSVAAGDLDGDGRAELAVLLASSDEKRFLNVFFGAGDPGVVFVRGDSNADGKLNIADPIHVLTYLFRGGKILCAKAADSNDDGKINLADAVAILGRIFAGAPPLPEPFSACGEDPTPDELTCDDFPPCR